MKTNFLCYYVGAFCELFPYEQESLQNWKTYFQGSGSFKSRSYFLIGLKIRIWIRIRNFIKLSEFATLVQVWEDVSSESMMQVVYRILTGKTLQLPEDEPSLTDITDTEINALLQVDIGGPPHQDKIVKVRYYLPVIA